MRSQSVSSPRARPRVAGRDRRLQRVRPSGAAERLRACERVESAPNEHVVPARAILIEQEHRLAAGTHARARRATPGSP